MIKEKIIIAFLCGGVGKRLWPISTEKKPKQFLSLINDHSLVGNSLQRLSKLKNYDIHPILIGNENHKKLLRKEAKKFAPKFTNEIKIILEPVGRNTTCAFLMAAIYGVSKFGKSKIILIPSDHYIANEDNFIQSLEIALQACDKNNENKLITLGIKPDSPHVGYGYLKIGEEISDIYKLDKFIEKPDLQTANEFFASKNYLWNGGYYICNSQYFIDLCKKYAAEIYNNCKKSIENYDFDETLISPNLDHFKNIPNISIDYAIAEKTDEIYLVKTDMGWSDIGSWDSVSNLILENKPNIISTDNDDNIIINFTKKKIINIGVKNSFIIIAKDGIFICDRNRTEEIKNYL